MWTVLGPLVGRAKRNRQGQRPELPDRQFSEALLYRGRDGIPRRDPPAEFGAWDAVYTRFRRRVHSGSLQALSEPPTAEPAPGEVGRVPLDSTTVRAYQHAAGGRRPRGASARTCRPPSRPSAAAAAG